MNFFLERAMFINRAPFDRIELDFSENEIAILSAVNGKGKTTILSHITDAFYEMARPYYQNEFEGRANKFYRVSSPIYNLRQDKPSFVYFRFRLGEEIIDYVDIKGYCTESEFEDIPIIDKKIRFSEISQKLEKEGNIKKFSAWLNQEKATKIFSNNILTSFPAYRFEMPGYLTDWYKVRLNFHKEFGFSGYLENPIEVITGLPELANWVMDVVLDLRATPTISNLFDNLGEIVTQTLVSKKYWPLRFWVWPRHLWGTRIQIVNKHTGLMVYPTIFDFSSGESSLFCIFWELVKQADTIKNNIDLSEITGVVLIDEIEKHLHIKLQKEVLPVLFKLFPRVQFIVSSHSPFLAMGLSEVLPERSKIIDLDNWGISRDPTSSKLYKEVYELMANENSRFKELYESAKEQISTGTRPIIVTEGKTDVQHLKKAFEKLQITLDVDYFEMPDEWWGDSKLKALLENISRLPQARKVIWIFDRDVERVIAEIENDGQPFKNYGNNVYGICIPVPNWREQYSNISIEYYFRDEDLKKEKDWKRLYFDNEINFDVKRKPLSSIENPVEDFNKKILDDNIGHTNWIHSKAVFATLVETDDEFITGFDFTNFRAIFEKISPIINESVTVDGTEETIH